LINIFAALLKLVVVGAHKT